MKEEVGKVEVVGESSVRQREGERKVGRSEKKRNTLIGRERKGWRES